jgi:predicted nucleic acid-binding protein
VSTFVDTNVLVYAHDRDAGAKHRTAAALVRQLWDEREGVLSTQVLQEFYVTITRKIPTPLARRDARALVHTYSAWRVINVEPGDLVAASDLEDRHRLSFWDALIVVSAAKANVSLLVTEDLQPGRRLLDLRIQNPFVG